MATKLQLITAMYDYNVGHITDNSVQWQQFLQSASRNYKLPFDEQILVHAQRPEATAVLELEKWNTQFGRWVNKGATGIAVIDRDYPGKRRIKYYFDISDTHDSRLSRPIPLWEMKPEYEADVIETLEATFGELAEKKSISEAIIAAAGNAVTDNITDYVSDLYDCRENSFLEELDEFNVEVIYRETLIHSVAFMLMARCGLDPVDYFESEDFRGIHNFNTPDTVTLLGTATSAIAEMGLREIASTVINLQKAEKQQDVTARENGLPISQSIGRDLSTGTARRTFANDYENSDNNTISNTERSFEDGSINLQQRERIQDTRSDPAGGAGGGAWQIRVDAPTLPPKPPQGAIFPPVDERQAEPPSDGNRTSGDGAIGAYDNANGKSGGRDRADESDRPDGMDTANDEYSQPGGGNDSARTDLQLTIISPEEQIQRIEEAEGTAKAETPSVSSMFGDIPQEYIDDELCRGSGFQDGKYRIYEHFGNSHTPDETIKFLKNEYGIGGHSPLGENPYSVDHDGKGLHFAIGHDGNKITLTWAKVSKRIGELIAADRYLNPKEKDIYPQWLANMEEQRQQNAEEAAVREFLRREPTPADTTEYKYEYHLGDSVYIGSHEYEILSFDDSTVKLYDTKFPLINTEFSREEFDRKIRENPMNEHLKVEVLDVENQNPAVTPLYREYQAVKAANPESIVMYQLGDFYEVMGDDANSVAAALELTITGRDVGLPERVPMCGIPAFRLDDSLKKLIDNGYSVVVSTVRETGERHIENHVNNIEPEPYTPVPGDRYEIQGRLFVVESVDMEWDDVKLRDITFQSNVGFPIFRSEKLDFIRMYEPIHEEPAEPEPPLADNQHIEKIDGVEFVVTTPFSHVQKSRKQESGVNYPGEIVVVKHHIPQPEEAEPTIIPAWEKKKKPARANYFDAFPNVPMSERHNFKITDDNLGHGGAKMKFRANMDAIHLLHDLELDGQLATPEQQEIFSRYVGWGSLPQAFDANNGSWADEFLELQTSLETEEYESARASTLNAHYTSPTVIKAMYKAVENMGFRTGNILDPGCGVGNFQGLLPDSMNGSKVYGIEIDPITGRIAQQLYQKNSIAIQGYEKTPLPDSFFDLAIGNVPFGGYGVSDKKYDKHKFHIHDYFFAKTLDKVRPGGVVAFVTSSWTMDKKNPAVRKYIAQRAELLGAIRLPNNAFLANAGTQVTTDILFLQKRDRIIDVEPEWIHLSTVEDAGNSGETIAVNAYFAQHPEMMLGTMGRESGTRMYGNENSTTCMPFPDRELSDLLDEAIQNIHAEITEYERDEEEQATDDSIPADPSVRNFSYTVVDGKVYFRVDSRMKPQELSATAENRIKGMIAIRDCVRTLIEYQTGDYSDSDIKAEQAKLNRLYDSYTKKYGLISARANVTAFGSDSSYPLLGALEVLDENGDLIRKADMFERRTIRAKVEITHVDTASEALAVSLGEHAKVDLPFMSELTGMDEEALFKELNGVIFLNPMHGYGGNNQEKYLTADEYLSGNVREKLEWAKRSAEQHPDDYTVNVKALEAVQPTDLSASEIAVQLGATWLPVDVVKQFTFELLETPRHTQWNMKIHYSELTAEWNIEGKNLDRGNIKASRTYGTDRANAYKIIEETLNLRDIRIFDYVEDENGNRKPVLNKKETMIAQSKQEQIKAAFGEWIWKDPERRNRLVQMYNDKFNSIRPREYDGSHIKFVGMNPAIDLREHQVNAVAHIIYGGNTLLAHEVGAGKTFEMVAAAMEMKRLGLCSKSMVVVPNHIIEQFATEWLQLYPSANILVSTKKDFEPKNRRKFCARIATGDYDAVIIGHSQFEKIPMSIEYQQRMLEGQLEDILHGISEAKQNKGDKFTVKQLEKSRKSLQLRLDKLNDQSRKDDLVTFEELGINRLFVDESHGYKNLYLYTKMRNVGGIAQTEAQKSADMFMKCRYLDEETGGRGVIFATGTPISNSMVELYSIQRYLQYNTLRRNGLQHFDCWASTFGETVTAIELAPEGSGYRAKTRFAKFYNLPELMSMFREVADIRTAETLNLPTPKPNFHNVVITPSEMQQEMVEGLAERAEKVRNKMVDSSEDNMLCITNDGRKLALDQRLMNPMLPDYEQSKAVTAAENIYRHWEEGKEGRLAQLAFCDLSTPKTDGSFNVYADVRDKLIAKGVPAEEIAFIHDANTEAKKKELFSKVRQGKVRVLMGSTAKCGAGMNVQDRLIALHDLDVPWRPSDMTQRLGRIKRQGNKNPEVEIYRYVTEKTFDAYSYQLIENKQRFIAQIMTSKSPVRLAEDVDEQALSYAEIKALATGNPLIIEKCQLEMDVGKLKLLKSSFLSQRYDIEDKILKHYPAEIKRLTERIAGYEKDITTVAANPADKDNFKIILNGKAFDDRTAAGTEILEACQAMTKPEPIPLGKYRGFELELNFNSSTREYCVTLKGALSHTASLGNDLVGNISRLNNAVIGLEPKLAVCREQLESTKKQMEIAKNEALKPFPQEAELTDKMNKLNEINIALNLDEKDRELVDGAPDEGDSIGKPRKMEPEYER